MFRYPAGKHQHKRLLEITDLHMKPRRGEFGFSCVLKDPDGKPETLMSAELGVVLVAAVERGYLIRGVRRPARYHVAIVGRTEQIGCMNAPTDEDCDHAFREDPGITLVVIDRATCTCNES